jgi:hypothetical protein
MTENEPIHAQIMDNADFLRASPEYRKPSPGIMTRTIHDETMIYAWSPGSNHWFRFMTAVVQLMSTFYILQYVHRNAQITYKLIGISYQNRRQFSPCHCKQLVAQGSHNSERTVLRPLSKTNLPVNCNYLDSGPLRMLMRLPRSASQCPPQMTSI